MPAIARAADYQPAIAAAADRYAVSAALVNAIAHAESRFDPAAVSPAGATGIMQLMPATARQFGVDPTDANANIRGGTAYLRTLLDRYDGDIVCTIAAYNAGPGSVSKSHCVPEFRETRLYVARVLELLASAAD
jgi:soluble lytic murein transglycosylase-like protein